MAQTWLRARGGFLHGEHGEGMVIQHRVHPGCAAELHPSIGLPCELGGLDGWFLNGARSGAGSSKVTTGDVMRSTDPPSLRPQTEARRNPLIVGWLGVLVR